MGKLAGRFDVEQGRVDLHTPTRSPSRPLLPQGYLSGNGYKSFKTYNIEEDDELENTGLISTRNRTRNRCLKTIDRYFEISSNKSTISRELSAGVSSFLMCFYTAIVIPILYQSAFYSLWGDDLGKMKNVILCLVCLTSGISTILLGLFTNLPYTCGPGLSLSTYLIFDLVLRKNTSLSSLSLILFSAAILVLFISIFSNIATVLSFIPSSVKIGSIIGVGMLLALISLQTVRMEGSNIGMGVVLVVFLIMTACQYRKSSYSVVGGVLMVVIYIVFSEAYKHANNPDSVESTPFTLESQIGEFPSVYDFASLSPILTHYMTTESSTSSSSSVSSNWSSTPSSSSSSVSSNESQSYVGEIKNTPKKIWYRLFGSGDGSKVQSEEKGKKREGEGGETKRQVKTLVGKGEEEGVEVVGKVDAPPHKPSHVLAPVPGYEANSVSGYDGVKTSSSSVPHYPTTGASVQYPTASASVSPSYASITNSMSSPSVQSSLNGNEPVDQYGGSGANANGKSKVVRKDGLGEEERVNLERKGEKEEEESIFGLIMTIIRNCMCVFGVAGVLMIDLYGATHGLSALINTHTNTNTNTNINSNTMTTTTTTTTTTVTTTTSPSSSDHSKNDSNSNIYVHPKSTLSHSAQDSRLNILISVTALCTSLFLLPPPIVMVESATGIQKGGRTGLTSIISGILFLTVFPSLLLILTIFPLSPFSTFLSQITSPHPLVSSPLLLALALTHLAHCQSVNFKRLRSGAPAFVTAVLTGFTADMALGLIGGCITYGTLWVLTGKFEKKRSGNERTRSGQ